MWRSGRDAGRGGCDTLTPHSPALIRRTPGTSFPRNRRQHDDSRRRSSVAASVATAGDAPDNCLIGPRFGSPCHAPKATRDDGRTFPEGCLHRVGAPREPGHAGPESRTQPARRRSRPTPGLPFLRPGVLLCPDAFETPSCREDPNYARVEPRRAQRAQREEEVEGLPGSQHRRDSFRHARS